MIKTDAYEASHLLYDWLNIVGKKKLESIKNVCDFLAESRHLKTSNPIWEIFWPMVFSGVIDYAGKGYYALTEPLIIDYTSHFYYINYRPKGCATEEISVGIYKSETLQNEHDIKITKVRPREILKRFTSIDKVVDNFPQSTQDVKDLTFFDFKHKRGLAKLEANGLKKFFYIPEKVYVRELPDKENNPEAFALAYCYSRVINKENNGTFFSDLKRLEMPSFAMPFILYRVLQLETMASLSFPRKENNVYVFENISNFIVRELNRILCNSIKYE